MLKTFQGMLSRVRGRGRERHPEGILSSGNKCLSFKTLHENHYTDASGRELCVVIFGASILIEEYVFPD